MFLFPTDPWDDALEPKARSPQVALRLSAERCAAAKLADPALDKALARFADNLRTLEGIYGADPAVHRANRSFVVVDLPAIEDAVRALAASPEGGAGTEVLAHLLKQAMQRAEDIRVRSEARDVARATLALSVLKDGAPDDAALPRGAEDALLPGSFLDRIPGWGRAGRAIAAGDTQARAAWAGAGKLTRSVATEIGDRTAAGLGLVGNELGAALEGGTALLADPVSVRLTGLLRALDGFACGAIGSGLVAAILFPPAVPVALALAALDGADAYTRTVEAELEKARVSAEAKSNLRRTRRREYLARCGLTEQTVCVQTDALHARIDLATSRIDAVLLRGEFACQNPAALPAADLARLIRFAPDPETRRLLEQCVARPDAA